MKTRVSVVVPCYNNELQLADCLQSLKGQTVAPHEVIVVDNNCTDGSVAVAKSFGAKVVKETKQGIGYARNKGFNAATGDIIARLDTDSIADKQWIQAIRDAMEDDSVAAAGGVSYTYELRQLPSLAYGIHRWFNTFHERRMGGLVILYGFNVAVRKKVWEQMVDELDEESLNEDIEFSVVARKYGQVVRAEGMIVGNRLREFMSPKKLWRYWKADGKVAKQLRDEDTERE